MSDSPPATATARKAPRLRGRGVAITAAAVLLLAVGGIVYVAERRAGQAPPPGGPAIGTQSAAVTPPAKPGEQAAARPGQPPGAQQAQNPPASGQAQQRQVQQAQGQQAQGQQAQGQQSQGQQSQGQQSQGQQSQASSAQSQQSAAAGAPEKPSFDIVHVGPEGGAVIAGRAAPDADVTVRNGTSELGHARADARGEWVLLPAKPLAAGPQELTVTARDRQGGKPVQGDGSVVLTVPERGGKPGAAPSTPALAVLTPDQGGPRVLQAPPVAGQNQAAAGQRTNNPLGMDAVDYDQNGNIRFGGNAKPGAPVRVYVDNKPAGDAQADAQGRWALAPGQAVSPGQHELRVDQLDARGKVVSRVELPFHRVELSAEEIGPGRIVVQPGENLWRIARHTYGRGIHYTVIYRANLDQIRDPGRIYPGQVFATPSEAGAPVSRVGAPPEPPATSSIRSR